MSDSDVTYKWRVIHNGGQVHEYYTSNVSMLVRLVELARRAHPTDCLTIVRIK